MVAEASREPLTGPLGATARAFESLRGPLAKFVGTAGYCSLLARAVAIARAEVPALGPVRVLQDGSLRGPIGIELQRDPEAGHIVLALLLGLLVTFIGEPLTLRLVGDAWPGATEGRTDGTGEGRS